MFSPTDRETLRDALVATARDDPRLTGAALTGSAALGAEDEWSDVDLAFGVAASADRDRVIADWSARMYRDHGAVHHTDVARGSALFRVFLLENTLQVDLAFWPEGEFGAIAPTFRLLFGTAHERPRPPAPSFEGLVGMGWLYALHARSSIARGRPWQAEYMISGVRDQALALACLRHDLPAVQGRGVDRLPSDVASPMAGALVRSLEPAELRRAFGVACERLLGEVDAVAPELGRRLAAPVRELTAGRHTVAS
ncbi:MAG TPA: hypothetical protein VFS44_08980 [Gemmatimonadaceae bacterium]|nr:hypothetical protein [Gemmatimonadaceae bacterium]